ncbi:hypothetical protein ACHAWT_003411 [Skeletonema menzelii]
MVNNSSISTTQSLDRLVGTAAIIGLSLAVVLQWLSSSPSDENDVFIEEGSNPQQLLQEQDEKRDTAAAAAAARMSRRKIDGNNNKSNSSSAWWWPLAIMRRRTKKRRKQRKNSDNIIANHPRNRENTNEDSSSCDEGYCNHLGSCKCGSIRFILKGPRHIQPIQSPGKIQYPHIRTSANNFHLLQGEADMRFQYVQESNDEHYDSSNNNNNNNNTTSGNNHHGDDSSTIATEQHNEKQYHHASFSLGAHVFCGNCGAHVMHADRSSEELEVNANCLMEKKEQHRQQQNDQQQQQQRQIQQHTSSLSSLSTIEGDTTTDPTTSTRSQQQQQQQQQQLNSVSEHELFLGSAQFWMELDSNNHSNTSGGDNNNNKLQELENSHHARTESISSTGEQTHPESYTTMLDTPTYEGDDYSMDGSSSLVAPAGGGGGGGASSSASLSVNTTGLLPPLPPSRLPPPSSSSDSKSVRTLPPWFGERPGYASHPSRSVGGGWSVASMETNDLDSVGGESTTVSPRMRDQMKFYMSRYMKDKKKSERSGSV